MNQTEDYLIGLMRDVCEELGLPEEKVEHCPILEALNKAHNHGAQGCAERFARQGLLKADQPAATEAGQELARLKSAMAFLHDLEEIAATPNDGPDLYWTRPDDVLELAKRAGWEWP